MPKTKKKEEICKICLQPVTLTKDGLKCQGACGSAVHYKCVNYTPGKIKDIQKNLITVLCPCPHCDSDPSQKHDIQDDSFTCDNIRCPANNPPSCENLCCQANEETMSRPATKCPPPGSLKMCGEELCEMHKSKPCPPQLGTQGNSPDYLGDQTMGGQPPNNLQCKSCGAAAGANPPQQTPRGCGAQNTTGAGQMHRHGGQGGGGCGRGQMPPMQVKMPTPCPRQGQMPAIQADMGMLRDNTAIQTCPGQDRPQPCPWKPPPQNEPQITPAMINNMCCAVKALTQELRQFMGNLDSLKNKPQNSPRKCGSNCTSCPHEKIRCPARTCMGYVSETTSPYLTERDHMTMDNHYRDQDIMHLKFEVMKNEEPERDQKGPKRHCATQKSEMLPPLRNNRNKQHCFVQTAQDIGTPCFCPEEDFLKLIDPYK